MPSNRYTTSLQTRHVIATLAVVTAHAGLLWLLQAAQQNQPAEEFVIPVRVVMDMVQPAPSQAPAVTVAQQPPKPDQSPRPVTPPPRPTQTRPAATVPIPTPATPTVTAPAAAPQAAPSAQAVLAEQAAPAGHAAASMQEKASPAPAATPGAPRVEQPTSDADYLNNPKPRYPGRSKSRGEEGTVFVRLFVEVDGSASNAEIEVSSGYVLLDRAGLQAASRWKYVPGKRDGVPVPMWVTVPVKFQLTDK